MRRDIARVSRWTKESVMDFFGMSGMFTLVEFVFVWGNVKLGLLFVVSFVVSIGDLW